MSFFKDVGELRAAIKANVKAGKGNRSLIEAVEAMKQEKQKKPVTPKRHGRTFLISALFGAFWQGTRRR